MITIGFSTRNDNKDYIDHLKSTVGLKNVQIIQKINPKTKSLTQVYNEILEESIYDIVILCHDDLLFIKNYWGKRVLEHFTEKADYGILGIAGTRYFPSSGMWWEINGEMMGQVYHQKNGQRWLSEYSKPFGGKIHDAIIVDGLFLAINKKQIKKKFNEDFDGFHFYDISFCLENFLENVKVGVISNIDVVHLSIGEVNQEWHNNRIKLAEKFNKDLPIIIGNKYPTIKMDEKLPLVSVIIPIYNYGLMFEKTITSVLDSTYKNYEIIIVNDGSTDRYVLEKLKILENVHYIKIINQDNGGPSHARNTGVKNAKGAYILPLDADDMISPDYIANCVSILKNNEKISPVYCDTNHIGEMRGVENRPEWSMERLIQGPFIVNCSMFHKKAFEECGGYDETLSGWEDYDLWIRMGIKGYIGKRIPRPLFTYFHHEKDGTISTKANQNQAELKDKIFRKNFG